MTFLILAVSAFGAIIETITVNEIYGAFGHKKEFAKKSLIWIGVVYIILTMLNTEFNFMLPVILILLFAFISSISYKITKIKIILISILATAVIAIAEVLVAVVFSIIDADTAENLLANPMSYVEILLVSKAITFCVARFIKHLGSPKERLYVRHGIAFSLISISTILILFILSYIVYVTKSNMIKLLVILSTSLLAVANIAMYKVSDYIVKEIKHRNDAENKVVAYKQEVKNYSELVSIKRENARFSHDIKHKLFVVNELIKADNEEGGKIIEEICGMLAENEIKNYTDKKSIDSLLNAKRKGMLNEGVDPEIRVFLSQKIKVSEMDLCVILGNLMDNALESVKDIDSKIIKITITDKGKYLIVNVKNTAEDKPITLGETSKEDKEQHGFGLPNVKEIVEMYDGELTYGYNDGMFGVSIMMKNIAI